MAEDVIMKGLNKSATESCLLTAAGLFEHV